MNEMKIANMPIYKWQVEVFPDVFLHSEERPNIWKRFWFKLFFGLSWEVMEWTPLVD